MYIMITSNGEGIGILEEFNKVMIVCVELDDRMITGVLFTTVNQSSPDIFHKCSIERAKNIIIGVLHDKEYVVSHYPDEIFYVRKGSNKAEHIRPVTDILNNPFADAINMLR